MIALLTLSVTSAFAAETAPVGFTRLVIRDEDGTLLGATDAFRIPFLEEMREKGLDARGAEDLVFGRDDSASAEFLVGGTVTAVDSRAASCEVAVGWQVLDRRRDAVVYRVTTRGFATAGSTSGERCVAALNDGFERMLSRDAFRAVLAPSAEVASGIGDATWDVPLAVASCKGDALPLPARMPDAMTGVVVIKTLAGMGSGVVVSPDGFVVTAAHVVVGQSAPQVNFKSGLQLPATVVRVDTGQDVAILKVPGAGYPCLASAAAAPPVGAEVYAIGAPGGEGLEFSVSKGVVSGERTIEAWRFLQTDASINPGNSGGPLLDAQGRVVAVVSWKIAAAGFEGLGFGVPMDALNARLGLAFGAVSDTDLAARTGSVGGGGVVAPAAIDDTADPVRSPIVDLDRPASLPPGTTTLGWSEPDLRRGLLATGAVTGAVGVALIVGSYADYVGNRGGMTSTAWNTDVALNVTGWVGVAAGATALTAGVVPWNVSTTTGRPLGVVVGGRF